MQYHIKQLAPDKWLVCDADGTPAIAKPCSLKVAQKLAARWNELSPEAGRRSAPAEIRWSDAGSTVLMATMSKYGFVIPAKRQADWRAPRDESGEMLRGSLPSLSISSATLLATDGIVAYFVLGDDETLLYGHLAAFEENLGGPAGDKRKDGKAPSAKKVAKVQAALDLLNKHFGYIVADRPPASK